MALTEQEQPPTLTQYNPQRVATKKEAGPLLKIISRALKPKAPKMSRAKPSIRAPKKKVRYY